MTNPSNNSTNCLYESQASSAFYCQPGAPRAPFPARKPIQINSAVSAGSRTHRKRLYFGYEKYVVYSNPVGFSSWKKKITKGVDKVLKIGKTTLYLEESFCSHPYTYRTSWFDKCRLKRFEGYPHNENHVWIVLTNRPENFQHVKPLTETHNILIMDIVDLVNLIDYLGPRLSRLDTLLDYNNNNNVYTSSVASGDEPSIGVAVIHYTTNSCNSCL